MVCLSSLHRATSATKGGAAGMVLSCSVARFLRFVRKSNALRSQVDFCASYHRHSRRPWFTRLRGFCVRFAEVARMVVVRSDAGDISVFRHYLRYGVGNRALRSVLQTAQDPG